MESYAIKAQTQKAKGVLFLSWQTIMPLAVADVKQPIEVRLLTERYVSGDVKFPCFARPCPKVPRHGFVESRVVNSWAELFQTWNEARAADPEAEVLIMPLLSGRVSAVARSSSITWGKGHDGATSGNGARIIPCPADSTRRWNEILLGDHAAIKQEAWLELVENDNASVAVQMRDGPAIAATLNYVPEEAYGKQVKRLISLSDLPVPDSHPDALLHWEKLVASAEVSGTVILLPGKTLASHFAVHGIQAQIPVLCSDDAIDSAHLGKPLLVASSVTIPQRSKAQMKHLAEIINSMEGKDFGSSPRALMRAIASLHSQSIWQHDEHLEVLAAESAVALTRFLAAAAMGEMRHFTKNSYNELRGRNLYDAAGMQPSYGLTRNTVYKHAFSMSWPKLLPLARECAYDFMRNGNGSYGGRAWAEIARAASHLNQRIDAFKKQPTQHRLALIVNKANEAVNLCHNGGNVFNKWLGTSHMDYLAMFPVLGFMTPNTGAMCCGFNTDLLGMSADESSQGFTANDQRLLDDLEEDMRDNY